MSYAAIEVELRNGRIIARNGETLPSAARALLVVLETGATSPNENGGRWPEALSLIRARQADRGHSPNSADAVSQQVRRERESWE